MARRRVAGLLALALAGVGVRGCVLRPAASLPGSHYNVGANAAWLSIAWVNEPKGAAAVEALASELRSLQISDAYIYVSYLRPSGQFGETFAHAAAFTRAMNEAAPGVRLQAWLGVPMRWHGGLIGVVSGHAELSNAQTRATIAAFSARVVREGGFDGVHLDPEPIEDGDPHVLSLLEEVRAALDREDRGATLSIATPRIQPLFAELRLPKVGPPMWSAAYYREVARRVDQIALMTYDSAMPHPVLYRHWSRFQVISLSRALEGLEKEVLVGIPTSREETFTHRAAAENMASGLLGTIDGLNDAAARARVITGVAIYPHWETTPFDWRAYRRLWLGETDPS